MGIFSSIGNFIGAPIGGLLGGISNAAPQNNFQGTPYSFNNSAFQDPYLQQNMNGFQGAIAAANQRQAPQVYAPDLQGQQDFRNQQMALATALQNQINGTGQSAAQLQLQQGGEQNLKSALSLAASARGNANPGALQRNLSNQFASNQANLNGQSALLRAQESQNATGQLSGLLNQGRTQDQQAAYSNAQLNLQQQQMNNQLIQYFTSLGYNEQQAQFAANQELEKQKAAQFLGVQGINSGVSQANQQAKSQFLGGILSAGGAAGAAALGSHAH